jgi:hypothetical protein
MKLYSISFNKEIPHLRFKYMLNWRKLMFLFGKLFESYFVFGIIENNTIYYGSTDNKFSLEHKLHFKQILLTRIYKMFERKNYIFKRILLIRKYKMLRWNNYILKQTHLIKNIIILTECLFFYCIKCIFT